LLSRDSTRTLIGPHFYVTLAVSCLRRHLSLPGSFPVNDNYHGRARRYQARRVGSTGGVTRQFKDEDIHGPTRPTGASRRDRWRCGSRPMPAASAAVLHRLAAVAKAA
jgi:hypothetical protein